MIDVIANGQDQNAVYFGDSAGYNSVKIRGYSTATTPTAFDGTPHSTDDIDITISGGYSQILRKVVKANNLPVAKITGAGGGQSGATGYSVQRANISANSIRIYPSEGQKTLGLGINTPYAFPALTSAVFTVSDSTGGQWIIIKGV